MIIAIDFDGTIADHRYPDLGSPVPGAIDWMQRWVNAGAKIILWTMRSDGNDGPTLTGAVEYLHRQGVELWSINDNPDQHTWTDSPKALANLYIDDRAFGCPLRENPRAGGAPIVDWAKVGPAVWQQLNKRSWDGVRKRRQGTW